MVVPLPALQQRMAIFSAQPVGPGLFLRDAAFLDAHLERPQKRQERFCAQAPKGVGTWMC